MNEDRGRPASQSGSRRAHCEGDAANGSPPSVAVIEALSEHKDVDPTELETVLYDVVDPDALDALFDGRNGGGTLVRFVLSDHVIAVEGDGSIHVESLEECR